MRCASKLETLGGMAEGMVLGRLSRIMMEQERGLGFQDVIMADRIVEFSECILLIFRQHVFPPWVVFNDDNL